MDLVVSCPIELTDGGVAIQIDSEGLVFQRLFVKIAACARFTLNSVRFSSISSL